MLSIRSVHSNVKKRQVAHRLLLVALTLLTATFFSSPSRSQSQPLAPVAVVGAAAGYSLQVNEGDFLVLDGSASYDQNAPATPLTYIWTQIAGPTAYTAPDSSGPSHLDVYVPSVGGIGGILTFQLTVTNAFGLSASSNVNVQIKVADIAPVASIVQPSQPYAQGSLITIDASATYSPNGNPITYFWQQNSGPPVALNLNNPAKPTFIAPLVGVPMYYGFELFAFDGTLDGTATVTVQTVPAHHAPIANAGVAETVGYGALVTLNGTASTDPDGNSLTYTWTQTGGSAVILNTTNAAQPTFTAPSTAGPLTFSLTVSDAYLSSVPTTVTISVFPPNAIPNCGAAHANKTILWSPNETFARIKIRGLEADPKFPAADNSGDDGEGAGDSDDPNEANYQFQVRVTAITQDELGILTPDAIVQSSFPNGKKRVRDLILVRRERDPNDQGRIYTINFTVSNNLSPALTCTASVKVCVPVKRGQTASCVATGQSYNSFTQ